MAQTLVEAAEMSAGDELRNSCVAIGNISDVQVVYVM